MKNKILVLTFILLGISSQAQADWPTYYKFKCNLPNSSTGKYRRLCLDTKINRLKIVVYYYWGGDNLKISGSSVVAYHHISAYPQIVPFLKAQDSDADGLDDWSEFVLSHYYATAGVTPVTDPYDADKKITHFSDMDFSGMSKDGLQQLTEHLKNLDSDGDGASDYWEMLNGVFGDPFDPNVTPSEEPDFDYFDSDKDGIPDNVEINAGTLPWDENSMPQYEPISETNPDSDGDSYSDNEELDQGTDPNDASSKPGYGNPSWSSSAGGGSGSNPGSGTNPGSGENPYNGGTDPEDIPDKEDFHLNESDDPDTLLDEARLAKAYNDAWDKYYVKFDLKKFLPLFGYQQTELPVFEMDLNVFEGFKLDKLTVNFGDHVDTWYCKLGRSVMLVSSVLLVAFAVVKVLRQW